LASTSEARRILDACLAGRRWDEADLRSLIEAESPALFSLLAEGLSDRFEPGLSEPYAELFAEVIAAVRPEFKPADLVERYRRVSRPRRCDRDPQTVYVLSRVTLGADIAIASVLLDGLKRRFPAAHIVFAAPPKSYELFSGDRRIEHLPVIYGRGASLRDRIGVLPFLSDPESIVVDPDSRITQLGLLPVCPEENYYFLESRTYGGDGDASLGCLARRWVSETFGVEDAAAYLAPAERPAVATGIALSLGVGGNSAKLLPPPFESHLLRRLIELDTVIVDAGAGGEEAERVARAVSGLPVAIWKGSFAGFASILSRSRLYIGYDSAGQHAAAAAGVPLVTVFAGAPCDRFRNRWRPTGHAAVEVIRPDPADPQSACDQAVEAARRLLRLK
jgi:ADP-heptose:LPS heptosyltransferase